MNRLPAVYVILLALVATACSRQGNEVLESEARFRYISASTLAEEIGWGGGDGLASLVTGLDDFRRRCAEYDGQEIVSEIGIINGRETAQFISQGYVELGGRRTPVSPDLPLQTQPPGTARPFGRSVWVNAVEAPNLVADMLESCDQGNICNYAVEGVVRYDASKLAGLNSPGSNPVQACMLYVNRFRFIGQNGFYTAIAGSAATQAVGEHIDEIVGQLEPGQ